MTLVGENWIAIRIPSRSSWRKLRINPISPLDALILFLFCITLSPIWRLHRCRRSLCADTPAILSPEGPPCRPVLTVCKARLRLPWLCPPLSHLMGYNAGIAAAVFCCLLLCFPEFLPAPVSSSIPIPACAVVVLSAHVDATFQIYSKAFRHLGK